MKIAALAHRVPSRLMTNADMIEMVDRFNPDISRLRKAAFFRAVRTLYGRLGASTRYIRDLEAGEKAADVILGALDDALSRAGLRPEDIDLLIYCGVGRGFLEPANAYFYAKARGMHRANCFDVTDACMSWVRALQIANLMLGTGTVRNAVVVNGEFHLGIHDNWKIESLDSLAYNFPMFTIGEAATATLLVAKEPDNFSFAFRARPEISDLCTIPMPGYEGFCHPSDRIGKNGDMRFTSFGHELHKNSDELWRCWRNCRCRRKRSISSLPTHRRRRRGTALEQRPESRTRCITSTRRPVIWCRPRSRLPFPWPRKAGN